MADIADDAQAAMELEAKIMEQFKKSRAPELPKGECLVCGEDTVGSFCGVTCRDQYEQRIRINKILGAK